MEVVCKSVLSQRAIDAELTTILSQFFINLPFGALALAVLAYFLKLNPHTPPSARELLAEFDFLGLFLLIVGLVVLLFGFSSGESNWSSTETIACLTIGCAVLCAAIVVELKTKRSPIIPPRLFKIRTSAAVLIGTFMQSFGFMALSYYVSSRLSVLVAREGY